jgi:hypothetical protein
MFDDGSTVLGIAILDITGKATLTGSFRTAGSHVLTALYSGERGFAKSTSAAVPITVVNPQATTTTTVASSIASLVVNQALTLTASVRASSGKPTGTVTFKDRSTTLGSASLDSTGKATLPWTFTVVGSHAVTAVYAGDRADLGSTSAVLPLTVSHSDGPGTTVTASVRALAGGGAALVVLGTNGDNHILLSQQGNNLILTTQNGTSTRTPPTGSSFVAITVYGFDGNDTIRLDASVSSAIHATLSDGAGNDVLINNGQDPVTINTGDGNSTVVTVGGGSATINGGKGLDSFWVNPQDQIANVTAAEQAAKSIHHIVAFTPPVSGGSVPLTISGQTMTEPAAGYGYTSRFVNQPLFAGTPQFNDIMQGYLGDCYFLAALSSLAQTDPVTIQESIAALGDGTYAVRFFKGDGTEAYYRIDAQLPTVGDTPAYARLTRNGQALWVPLLEKAFAEFRYGQNSYSSIEGGWMGEAYTAVAGAASTGMWANGDPDVLAQLMAAALAQGNAVTAGSYVDSTGPIIGGHAYEIHAVEYDTASGSWYVTVYNPWGIDGVNYDSNPNDGLLRLTVGDFQAHFEAVDICNLH